MEVRVSSWVVAALVERWRLRMLVKRHAVVVHVGCMGATGAESQEEVGEGIGTAVRGAGGRAGKGR